MRRASPACPSRRAIRARKATVPRSSWRAARLLGSEGQTRERERGAQLLQLCLPPIPTKTQVLTHRKSPATWGEAWQSPDKARLRPSTLLAGDRWGCSFPRVQEEPWHSPSRRRSQSPPAEASQRGEPSPLRGPDRDEEAAQSGAAIPLPAPYCRAPSPRPSHGSSLSKGHGR